MHLLTWTILVLTLSLVEARSATRTEPGRGRMDLSRCRVHSPQGRAGSIFLYCSGNPLFAETTPTLLVGCRDTDCTSTALVTTGSSHSISNVSVLQMSKHPAGSVPRFYLLLTSLLLLRRRCKFFVKRNQCFPVARASNCREDRRGRLDCGPPPPPPSQRLKSTPSCTVVRARRRRRVWAGRGRPTLQAQAHVLARG